MSIHDETWNKCHICGQTIKNYHGSYHDSGWCKDMSFEEYSKPKKEMKESDLQYQNRILRAALEKKPILFKHKSRDWNCSAYVLPRHEFNFWEYDYKLKEEIEEPVIVDFTIKSIKQNFSNDFTYLNDEIDGEWSWTTQMINKLKMGTNNRFILLTDSVKKALDKEGIKYDQ